MEQNFVSFPQLGALFKRILAWRKDTGSQGGAYSILFERHHLLKQEANLIVTNTRKLEHEIETAQRKQMHARNMIKITRQQQEANYNRMAANQARIRYRS